MNEIMHNLLNIFTSAAAAPLAAAPQSNPMQLILPIAAMALFFWILILRPQKREKAKREAMINAMKKGDRVITIGGMHGKIADLDTTHNTVTIEIAPKITVKFNRSAIASVEPRGSDQSGGEPEQKIS
jgi:preprotein translocase subunit YajC